MRSRFLALQLSVDLVRVCRPLVEKIAKRDRKLEDQLRRALTSCPLNLSEGSRRTGNDRRRHYRIAGGSLSEAQTALLVAEAWRYLERSETREALTATDRLLGILWPLTR